MTESETRAQLRGQMAALRDELRLEVERRNSAERVVQHLRTLLEEHHNQLVEAREQAGARAELQLALAESRQLAVGYQRDLARLRARLAHESDDGHSPDLAELRAELAEARGLAEASSAALECAFDEITRLEQQVDALRQPSEASDPAQRVAGAPDPAQRTQLKQVLAALSTERDGLAAELADLRAARAAESDEVGRAQAELAAVVDERDALARRLRALGRQYDSEVGGLRGALKRSRQAHEDDVGRLRAKLDLMRTALDDTEPRVEASSARLPADSDSAGLAPRVISDDPFPLPEGPDVSKAVRSMRAAHASGDYEWLASIARQLKVTFEHRGVRRLADLASHVELASWAGDIGALPGLVVAFETAFDGARLG